jgi:hypothetical protein
MPVISKPEDGNIVRSLMMNDNDIIPQFYLSKEVANMIILHGFMLNLLRLAVPTLDQVFFHGIENLSRGKAVK